MRSSRASGKTFRCEVHNQLTAARVAKMKKPGMYADGGGLYLNIAEGGSKSWIWRGVVRGRRRELGLGPVRDYSLAEAREKAREFRKAARDGRDPKAERDAALRRRLTLQEAADRHWREAVEPSKSAKLAVLWNRPSTLMPCQSWARGPSRTWRLRTC